MHSQIEMVDEERYDFEAKVIKNYRDVCHASPTTNFKWKKIKQKQLKKGSYLSSKITNSALTSLDQWTEFKSAGPWWEVQEAGSEKSESFSRWDDESALWLQNQRIHGPEGKSEVSEERRYQTREGMTTAADKPETLTRNENWKKPSVLFLGAEHGGGWLA